MSVLVGSLLFHFLFLFLFLSSTIDYMSTRTVTLSKKLLSRRWHRHSRRADDLALAAALI